jgi:hypothetical protein
MQLNMSDDVKAFLPDLHRFSDEELIRELKRRNRLVAFSAQQAVSLEELEYAGFNLREYVLSDMAKRMGLTLLDVNAIEETTECRSFNCIGYRLRLWALMPKPEKTNGQVLPESRRQHETAGDQGAPA